MWMRPGRGERRAVQVLILTHPGRRGLCPEHISESKEQPKGTAGGGQYESAFWPLAGRHGESRGYADGGRRGGGRRGETCREGRGFTARAGLVVAKFWSSKKGRVRLTRPSALRSYVPFVHQVAPWLKRGVVKQADKSLRVQSSRTLNRSAERSRRSLELSNLEL